MLNAKGGASAAAPAHAELGQCAEDILGNTRYTMTAIVGWETKPKLSDDR